jgi:succinate dehydrogenase/fumarate reductase flavoprotein subunit
MRAMGSGERSGRGAAAYLRSAAPVSPDPEEIALLAARATAPLERRATWAPRPDDLIERMHALIFDPGVSISKRGEKLGTALGEIEDLCGALPDLAARDPHELAKLHETRNMIRVAEMFLRASLTRTESRSSHFRVEHPELDNERWLAWINLRKGEGGKMRVETEPVPLDDYPIQPRSRRVRP